MRSCSICAVKESRLERASNPPLVKGKGRDSARERGREGDDGEDDDVVCEAWDGRGRRPCLTSSFRHRESTSLRRAA